MKQSVLTTKPTLHAPKTLKTIADLIGARLKGDPECLISGIATLETAKAGDVSFLSNQQYRKFLSNTEASAVIVDPQDAENCPVNALISDNSRLSLVKLIKLFDTETVIAKGIHPSVIIGEGCKIASSAAIGPNCVIGDRVIIGENVVINAGCVIGSDCSLGNHTTLKSRVTFYDRVRVGENCLIHSGAVIGSDGFGFANQGVDWVRMPHLGGVLIGDQVDIGANTTIDRGFLEDTILGDGVIIDNLVQVGHNVKIGARTAIAGCTGIAGSTSIGAACLIGGASNISGHLSIADKCMIAGTSTITHSIQKSGAYSSAMPARPILEWRKSVARFFWLDNYAKRLRVLEKAVSPAGQVTEDDE